MAGGYTNRDINEYLSSQMNDLIVDIAKKNVDKFAGSKYKFEKVNNNNLNDYQFEKIETQVVSGLNHKFTMLYQGVENSEEKKLF